MNHFYPAFKTYVSTLLFLFVIITCGYGNSSLNLPISDAELAIPCAPSQTSVVINEVDADTPGTDTLEFVELYDGGVGNTSLNGMVLVFYNGSNNLSYAAYDLDGQSTDANGYFVIGNAAVPNVSIVIPSNGLQNGADAVALYMDDATTFPNGTAVTTLNLLDAIVYDTNDGDDPDLLPLLNPGEPQVNEGGAGDKDAHSNQRIPNGSGGLRNTSTYAQIPPTPGAENGGPAMTPDFIINELDADTAGTDTMEFVELYDGGIGNSSLDGLVLVFYNGSNNLSYAAYDLDGQTTNANGYFVIGNAAVPNVSIVIPSNGLQNGADAVGLYMEDATSFPNGSAVTTVNLIDAIVYDTNDADDPDLLPLLNPGEPQVNEGGAGDKDAHSLQRIPNGSGGARNTSTYAQIPPTPGAVNAAPVSSSVIINELDADTAGTDTMEFVELYDGGVGNSSLDGLVLVFINGSNNLSYAAYDLDGQTTNANGYFVIGNAAVPNVSIVIPSNGLQNGADAVGLYMDDATSFPNGSAVTTVNLIDAIVYDTNDADDPDLLPLLNPGQPQVNEGGAGDKDAHSSQRIPNGSGGTRNTVTYAQIPPTPGAFNGAPAGLLINEVDADTAGTDTMEFVELFDGGAGNSSLDGFVLVLYNGSSDSSYNAFDLDGFSTDAQGYFVIGNAAVPNVDLVFPNNGLQNGADAVGLYMDDATSFPNGTAVTTTNLIDAFVYDTNDGDDAGLLVLLNAGQAQINEDGAGDKDAHSSQRIPNGSGGLRNTATYSQIPPTPGTVNGATPVLPISFIHDVQGSGLAMAMAGMMVRVEAIVVGDYQNGDQLNGFFIQEEDADADADVATSEGIFVYCDGCATDVAVGDAVDITGLAEDFFGMSQIDIGVGGSAISVLSSGNTLPTPATVTLPAPTSTESEGTFENVEGMLINVSTNLIVSEYFELPRYGQLVLSANNRIRQFTDENEPDVAGNAAFIAELDRSRIILDDDTNIQSDAITGAPDEAYFWPRPGTSNTNLIRGGDQINNLQGVMHWSFAGQTGTDAWRIRPVEEAFTYDFISNNPRTATPTPVGGNFKVASFNVLNYFTTLDERGADSTVELDRQREKIAAAICSLDADVIGLIEIENNGMTAVDDLLNGLNGINTICGSTYAAVNTGTIGSDAIAVAFIYNTATVSLHGAFAILDSSVNPLFNDDKNRPALAQSFSQISSGGVITVAVNHLKSKGSPCDDVGDPNTNDGSANCNQTRTNAAIALVDWLATDPTASGDPDFMIIGDLNAYRNETPIDAIKLGADDTAGTSDDFVDLLDNFLGASAYSFVFDGQLGYLDYALASQSLMAQLTGATAWHINADEANIFDYNDGIQDAGEASFERKSNALPIYEPNSYRASDHDPLLVGLNLGVAPTIICSSDINANNDPGECGAMVSFANPIATDPDGDLVSVIQTMGGASGSFFPIGVSTIEFTATDAAGHTSVCSFTITVVDNEPPIIVCQDITIQLDEFGDASIVAGDVTASESDNCGIASSTIDIDTFDCSHVGANNVTLTVTDVHGNVSSCMAVVTVEDVTAPEVMCQDITVQLDVNGMASILGTDVDNGSSDACGIASYDLDLDTFDCSHVGDNVVTLTVTDVNGNASMCTAIVTVEDNIEPALVCMDFTLELGPDGTAVLDPMDVMASLDDACGIETTAVDIEDFDCSDIGTPVLVTVFAADVNGNPSTCTAIVTVVDALAPVIDCPLDQTQDPGAGNLFYTLPDYWANGEATATDNCTDPVSIFTQDPLPGTLLPDGVHTITLTAEDQYGNIGTCSFELTVESILGATEHNLSMSTIVLYPNPATSLVKLGNPNNLELEIATIYDNTGRLIKTFDLRDTNLEYSLDISELSSGTYLVFIQGISGQITKQLIKR